MLAVLWLSAALAAVAFALATTVRGETERVSTSLDGMRSYYLAQGAVERAAVELLWSANFPGKRSIPEGAAFVDYVFPSGNVRVEIIPETAKLDVNRAPPEQLYRLMVALGIDPERSRQIAIEIDLARKPDPIPEPGLDNLVPNSSFVRPHASFQEIEELLLVKGVTPDIFYGTYLPVERGEGPRLVRTGGLQDCLTVYGSGGAMDANTTPSAVLQALGMSPYAATALVARRRIAPLTPPQLAEFLQSVQGVNIPLRLGGNSIVTLRATGRLRLANGQLADIRRTVAAQVKYMPPEYTPPIHILRWYDTAWSE